MKSEAAKITSKHQITIPKTVWSWLHLEEKGSVEFEYLEDGKVLMTKAYALTPCPFCQKNQVTLLSPCPLCKDKQTIETPTIETLHFGYLDFCLTFDVDVVISKDRAFGFTLYQSNHENKTFKVYQDMYQLEAIRLFLQAQNTEYLQQAFQNEDFKHAILASLALEEHKKQLASTLR